MVLSQVLSHWFPCAVPRLVGSSQGVVYAAPSESVRLRAQFQGVGISGTEWRHNGARILPQNGFRTTADGSFTQATLTIQQFNSSVHSGRYEFTVENPSGTTILAVWEIQRAGNGTVYNSLARQCLANSANNLQCKGLI